MKLFEAYQLGEMTLKNRMVMAPMTRNRAIDNVPGDLMAKYYSQRAEAGLIITEGTSPSPNGLGYPRIPGCFSKEHIDGWKKTTQAVHEEGGKIFLQIMHTGRVSHPLNLPKGAQVLAPSQVKLEGEMYTDQDGNQPFPMPTEMKKSDIETAKAEYLRTAEAAMQANFDGVEIHGANGYLIEQFISPLSNLRHDSYGGNVENRCKFLIEIAQAVSHEIGSHRTGVRLSPYGALNEMGAFEEVDETFNYLAKKLGEMGLCYLHLVDHSSMGAPDVPFEIKASMQKVFKNPLILSGGYGKERAEEDLIHKRADLIAFGRPFLANPDLPIRFEHNIALNEPREDYFYSPGAEGYTDYPFARVES